MSDPLLKWREEFPILATKKGYLINNSLGAMPRGVYARLKEYADLWASKGVVAWHDWLPMVAETADQVGALIGAPKGTTMMHQNVSTLTAIVISALGFDRPRDKVVLSELNFPSVVYNWMSARQRGARVEVVRSRDGLNLETEDVVKAIDDSTRIVALDLVLFRSSGLIDPRPIIEAAHRHGAYVMLDCYQATGAVEIDVKALGVDFVTGGSVKWLCGGAGACYLYVREDLIGKLQPAITGWFSDKHPFDFRFGEVDYANDAHRFMTGSPAVPALYAARSGYQIVGQVGVKAIRAKSLQQTALLMKLADEQGLKVNTPREPHRRGNTVCVDFEHSEDCSRRLIEQGYVIDWRPNGGIRISPHFYNSDEECRGIMAAIGELRKSGTLTAVAPGSRAH